MWHESFVVFWPEVDQRALALGLGRSCWLSLLTKDCLSRSWVSLVSGCPFTWALETNLGLAFLFLTVYAFFGSFNYLTGKQVAEETACERKFLELLAQATNVSPQSLKGILRRDLGLMGMPEKVWKRGKCFHLSLSAKITIYSRWEKNSAGGLLEWCEGMEKLGSGYLFQLDFFNGFVTFNFLNVDTHGEAELPHISCSCEPE